MTAIRPITNNMENVLNVGKNAIRGLLDPNTYATKKTIAQGLLDVALLTANASQLKYLLQVGTRHDFYHLMLVLISISIVLQLVVGVMFFFSAMKNINVRSEQGTADLLNNLTTLGVFVIVVVNVFISVFGMADDLQDDLTRINGRSSNGTFPFNLTAVCNEMHTCF